MTLHLGLAATERNTSRFRQSDAAVAAIAAAVLFALYAIGGFDTLGFSDGDNDSLLRLVEVRDLIAGQGWFDMHQYRMGPEGGFVSHWSRLVDAPIAVLVLAGTALTGSQATGETIALVIWPLLLAAAGLFALMRAARAYGGEACVLPAAVLGALAFHFTGIFQPGAIDHHNVQLVLTLAVVALLCAPAARTGHGMAAGACAAAMLAVGMEAAPYAAVAGAVAALDFAAGGQRGRRLAFGFGIGFAGAAAAAFLATVPPTSWGAAECDAYSAAQFVVAAVAGAGLALAVVLTPPSLGVPGRLTVLAALAACTGGVLMVFFPQCLADPYAGIDPRVRTYWLSAVTEAQPLWALLARKPEMVAGHYATAALGLAVLAWGISRRGLQREDAVVGAFLAAATLVGVWQVRGTVFATPLAMIPLAGMVAAARARAAGRQPGAQLAMAAAWLVSVNLVWSAGANALAGALGGSPAGSASHSAAAAAAGGTCELAGDFDMAAALPASRMLAVSNLGAPLLRYSGHHVLAGPYHRNVAGNLAALDAFMGSEAEALAVVQRQGVTYVAHCPGNMESGALAHWAPEGLMAGLMQGKPPAWLVLLPQTADRPLKIYHVALDQAPEGG